MGDDYDSRLQRREMERREEQRREIERIRDMERRGIDSGDRKGIDERTKYILREENASTFTEDQAKGFALKTEIETKISKKIADYLISNYPRNNNYTKLSYTMAIINVLKSLFKFPNNDIIAYIENKVQEEKKIKISSLFGFGGKVHKKHTRRIKR